MPTVTVRANRDPPEEAGIGVAAQQVRPGRFGPEPPPDGVLVLPESTS